MKTRAWASLFLALAACVPAASAGETADLRGRLLDAFLTGAPAPEAPAGDPLAPLSARLRAVQSGTDGSAQAQSLLLAEIAAVARELDRARPPMPPEPVLRDYLSRRASGASTPPSGATAAEQREASLARAHALAAALAAREFPADGALDSRSPLDATPAGTSAEAKAWAQAQLRGDFRVWSTPPPALRPGARSEALTAPSQDVYPVWNPSGNADFFASLGAYLHGIVDLRSARDSERLGRVERDGELACAGGWSVSCAVARTVGFAGAVVTGLEQQGAELTDADDGVRQRALLRLTPAALLESAPLAVSAVGEMRREDYSRASIGAASLAIGIAMLDATMLGPGKAARAGVLKATEKTAVEDGARVAAGAGDVRAQARVIGETAAPARTLDDAAVDAAYRGGDPVATVSHAAKAVDEVERVLLARGYVVRRTSRSGHLSSDGEDLAYDMLEIVSGPPGTALGRILGSSGMRTISERAGSPLRVFYDPMSLPMGAAGRFIPRDNSVNLSAAVLRGSLGAAPHPTLLHELKHAHFNALARSGRPTPYDVDFHFNTSDSGGYRRYFSMEELSTHRRDLIQALSRAGRSRVGSGHALRHGTELAARAQAALETMLARFNDTKVASSITLSEGRRGSALISILDAPPGALARAEVSLPWGDAGQRLAERVRRDLDARAAAGPDKEWAQAWTSGRGELVKIELLPEYIRVETTVPGASNSVQVVIFRKLDAEESALAGDLRARTAERLEASLDWARWHRAEFARIAEETDPMRGPLLLGSAGVATSFGLAGGGDERWEPRSRVCGFDEAGEFGCEPSGGRRR